MSEQIAEPVAATPTAAPAEGGASTSTEAPVLVGQNPGSSSTPAAETNPFEARFGSFSDAEGNFTDNTAEYLRGLGFDEGRVERMTRQGSVDNVFKALDHAQGLIEKRDGNRDYLPDFNDETAVNRWRDEKGIPRDPVDPVNGYNFKAGLAEGEDTVIPSETLSEIGKALHSSHMPKEQANALIGTVNESLAKYAAEQKDAFESDTRAREQKSYDEFKQKHGYQFEEKEAMLGQSAKAYGFDFDDPIDRAALTNPKVMQMMVDNAALSKTTAPMPGEGQQGLASSMPPQRQIEQIMKDHPNDSWKRDPDLVARVGALAKQAAARQR